MRNQRGQSTFSLLVVVTVSFLAPLLASYCVSEAMRPTTPSYGPAEQRADILATPMVQADAISLSPQARDILKAYGIQQLGVEPIGNSTASFNLVVNGQIPDRTYSTIHTVEQMYRIDVSSGEPKVYVTESIRKGWKPELVAFYIERELEKFDQLQRERAQLKEQWSTKATDRS